MASDLQTINSGANVELAFEIYSILCAKNNITNEYRSKWEVESSAYDNISKNIGKTKILLVKILQNIYKVMPNLPPPSSSDSQTLNSKAGLYFAHQLYIIMCEKYNVSKNYPTIEHVSQAYDTVSQNIGNTKTLLQEIDKMLPLVPQVKRLGGSRKTKRRSSSLRRKTRQAPKRGKKKVAKQTAWKAMQRGISNVTEEQRLRDAYYRSHPYEARQDCYNFNSHVSTCGD